MYLEVGYKKVINDLSVFFRYVNIAASRDVSIPLLLTIF